jgi:predicted amidohydrolase
MELSLVIRNGIVVDGSGGAPREADVAIQGDRIVAVGQVSGRGAEEIDAKGATRHPGLRRRPHPLRRPGDLGPQPHHALLAGTA